MTKPTKITNTELAKHGRRMRTVDAIFDRSTIDAESRTVQLAFSSETPVQRWFGYEILDHSQGAADLSRLNDGGALLFNHDPDAMIGAIMPNSAEIGDDRIGRCTVQFSRSALGQEKFQDVQDGILTKTSFAYTYDADDMFLVGGPNQDPDGDDDEPTYRVMQWQPLEVSMVAIPADATVGVGRSAGGAIAEPEQQPQQTSASATREQPAEPAALSTKPQPQRKEIMPDIDLAAARKEGAEAAQQRVADLLALADTYQKYGAREMVRDFINSGKTAADFQNAIMEKIVARHSDASELEIGMTDKEVRNYSLIRAINAVIDKDWTKAGFEREVSESIAKRMGVSPQGFFVPVEAFSARGGFSGKRAAFDATVTANTGDNLIQTTVLGSEFVDVLRNKLVFSRLGIRVLGGLTSNIAIPRKSAAGTVQNLAETTQFTATYPTTTQISMSPHRVGGSIPYSKLALIQSSLDVENMLRNDLLDGVAVEIENLGFNGSGTAPQPRGLVNQSGIGSVVGGTNGAQIAWTHIVGLESACANANAEPNANAGYVVNTKSRGWMKETQKATYLPYIWSSDNPDMPLNGYMSAVTNNLPSNGTKGTAAGVCSTLAFSSDWSNLVMAMFGGLDVVVDPYSLADQGQVKLTANQFIDFAVRQPAAFAVMTDALTA